MVSVDQTAQTAVQRRLPAAFFAQPTLQVARQLLGKYLVRRRADCLQIGKIVETEAYCGPEDKASHAFRGLTPRTRVMFGPPGVAYVYLIYGLHHLLNIVTEKPGYPAAVLIRALEPVAHIDLPTTGPAKLTKALGIDLSFNQHNLCHPQALLWVEDRGEKPPSTQIATSPRIGVDYAAEYARKPWRFYLKNNLFVSRL